MCDTVLLYHPNATSFRPPSVVRKQDEQYFPALIFDLRHWIVFDLESRIGFYIFFLIERGHFKSRASLSSRFAKPILRREKK
jgi:hypothetical protein